MVRFSLLVLIGASALFSLVSGNPITARFKLSCKEDSLKNHTATERILSEIRDTRLPSLADRTLLPYTTAACHEIQRCANIAAVNFVIFRQTTVDTSVQNKRIPAGTMVYGDLHQILATDPHFEQPEQFRPERYLAEDGKTLRKDLLDRTIPFGVGRREGLARVELFLGVAATLQRYRILPPADGAGVDLSPRLLNFYLPRPHLLQLEFVVRNFDDL